MRVTPFPPTQENLQLLYKKFDEHREFFSDELPRDPIHFVSWLASDDSAIFAVTKDDGEPVGVFIFTGIVPQESCYSHVYIWDRDALPAAEYVIAAQVAAAGVFQSGIRRITGVTPVTHLHARVFAERVGFVMEGRLRKACKVGGDYTDAWISGLLPEDLVKAAQAT